MNPQLIGMAGVYYTAAELSQRGFIVSLTTRSARGPDLLVTDQVCRNTWSIQVKTNANKRNSWQLGEVEVISSPTYLFVFVTLKDQDKPDYFVVESAIVAAAKEGTVRPYFNRGDVPKGDGWGPFEASALHDLTWAGAREIAKKPGHFSTGLLEKALTLLKPAKDNKLDSEHRKAIAAELTSRTREKPLQQRRRPGLQE